MRWDGTISNDNKIKPLHIYFLFFHGALLDNRSLDILEFFMYTLSISCYIIRVLTTSGIPCTVASFH